MVYVEYIRYVGGWTFKNEKHSNVKFEFKETSSQKKDIYFRDMRNFGTLKFSDSKKKLDEKLSTLGPDMFLKETTFEVFKKALNKKQANLNKTLPELLLKDQKTVSGVGNYIKSESLYIAKISPHRKLKDITETELKGLFQAIKKVIKQSYENKGVSKRDYSDINDEKGTYHNNFLVYGLKKDLKGNSVKTETTKDGEILIGFLKFKNKLIFINSFLFSNIYNLQLKILHFYCNLLKIFISFPK